MKKEYSCPACNSKTSLGKENEWRPFCSERCSLLDLGDWVNESNRIPGDEPDFSHPEADDHKVRH